MLLHALLLTKDDLAADTLSRVLAQFGVSVARSSAPDVALGRLADERFDQVIVDFEDAEAASLMLEGCRRLAVPDRKPPVTVALLVDARQVRSILDSGTHFILIKPINQEQATAALRAATAILNRERRQSPRVAVQMPISVHVDEQNTIEGIALDLSTGGMDVLAAKAVASASVIQASFDLPDGDGRIEAKAEVAWSTPNGQMGLRFQDMEPAVTARIAQWVTAKSHEGLKDEAVTLTECKLTDLSLGGCYVETESPFPQSSMVDLCLKAADLEIHTEGLVRVMHPGYGMGIEFPARTDEQRNHVEEFIACLTREPGTQPHLETSPRSLMASEDDFKSGKNEHGAEEPGAEDALLELLRSGSAMEQEEFLSALSRQRTPAGTEA